MATLASQLFAKTGRSIDVDEQLLKLFWNRAELKKELDKLRNENFLLTDELRQEQAMKLRVQQRFEQLESMLANPGTAATAVTYFQLRDVWNKCQARLEAVARELSSAHYDKEVRLHVANFRRHLHKSLTSVQHELDTVTLAGDRLSSQIRELREQRRSCRGLWNIFKRRRLTAEINTKRAERRLASERSGLLSGEIQFKSSIEPPEFGGLDTAAKRAINLTIIAYAQELYLLFAERDIASRAREASIMQVGDVRYGDRRECRDLRHQAERCLAQLASDSQLRDRVAMRVTHLQTTVLYRRDHDTIPAAEVLEAISLLKRNGKERGKVAVNVLADEYWDLFPALLSD